MAANDGVTSAQGDDGQWRWAWRSPWASQHHGATAYRSRQAALAAGRRWLKVQAR